MHCPSDVLTRNNKRGVDVEAHLLHTCASIDSMIVYSHCLCKPDNDIISLREDHDTSNLGETHIVLGTTVKKVASEDVSKHGRRTRFW